MRTTMVFLALAAYLTASPLMAHDSPGVKALLAKAQPPQITGTVHLERFGDKRVTSGEWAGTKGQSLRLEAAKLNIADTPEDTLRLEYLCHVQDRGDMGWMTEDSLCGSIGRSLRLEALRVRLAGPASPYFSVKYECHIEGAGDTGPYADGAPCGTSGESKRMEAVRIWIERKN